MNFFPEYDGNELDEFALKMACCNCFKIESAASKSDWSRLFADWGLAEIIDGFDEDTALLTSKLSVGKAFIVPATFR